MAATETRPRQRADAPHRLAERGVDRTLLLLVPAVVLLLACSSTRSCTACSCRCARRRAAGCWATTATFFSDAFERGTILKTLKLALPATVINVLASVPIAYRHARARSAASGC